MGGERFFRSRVSREKKKMKKKIKSSRKTKKSWHRIETSFKTATKQISANFKRPPKLRNAVHAKNGPRARWPRKVGGGGKFSPYTTQWKFPQRLREGVAFYFTFSASSSMSSSVSASLYLDLFQRKLCERRETASSEAN